MLQLELGESKPDESQSEQFKTETRKAAPCLSETLKSNVGQWRTGRGRMPHLEPRQSLEKSSIQWLRPVREVIAVVIDLLRV